MTYLAPTLDQSLFFIVFFITQLCRSKQFQSVQSFWHFDIYLCNRQVFVYILFKGQGNFRFVDINRTEQ